MTDADYTPNDGPYVGVTLNLKRRTLEDGTTTDGFDLVDNETGRRFWLTDDGVQSLRDWFDNGFNPIYVGLGAQDT